MNYYTVVADPEGPYIHAAYKPPYETTVLGWAVPRELRRSIRLIRWKWRAVTLPKGGDECADAMADSSAVVYVTWRGNLKWYSVKYVWSAVTPKGSVCDEKSNAFRAQKTRVVESGAPLNEWRTVVVDPDAEFRRYFGDGRSKAQVPDLMGIAIMSDGDQTGSVSEADYGGFVVVTR